MPAISVQKTVIFCMITCPPCCSRVLLSFFFIDLLGYSTQFNETSYNRYILLIRAVVSTGAKCHLIMSKNTDKNYSIDLAVGKRLVNASDAERSEASSQ